MAHLTTTFTRQQNFLFSGVVIAMAICMAAILYYNDGHFIYILDDPYIHLSLARQIAQGNYGLNAGEFATPSSSIVWPFLLVPYAALSWGEWVPLAINSIACLLTAVTLHKNLYHAHPRHAWLIALAITLAIGVGQVFTGMEHALQMLIAVYVVSNMIDLTEGRRLGSMLLPALVLGPLIRYETLGITLGAIVLLCIHRRYVYIWAVPLFAIPMLLFTYFLWSHTGHLLPASILSKMDAADSVINRSALLLLAWGVLVLLFCVRHSVTKMLIAAYVLAATLAHLLFAKAGWFFRYEAYLVASIALLLSYYLPSSGAGKYVQRKAQRYTAIALVLLVSATYVVPMLSIPVATYAVYAQQVQMTRLVSMSGAKGVAVNDIGHISYKGNVYTLDLWGLGSVENHSLYVNNDARLLQKVADKQISLVMLYPKWFEEMAFPKEWIKMGSMEIVNYPGLFFPLGGYEVDVYATNRQFAATLEKSIEEWKQGLPQHTVWKPGSGNADI